jgi:hypothetical protein
MTDHRGQRGIQPRPEARPLKWTDDTTTELTDDQKDAARRACKLLNALAEKAQKKGSEGLTGVDLFLPLIDAERYNHVVLIDGGRGSGKTALLITLLNAWAHGVRSESRDDRRYRDETFQPGKEFEELLRPRGRIVPVGLIDLQPLPRSTHLILHIASQFHRLVEAIEQSNGSGVERNRERVPWHAVADSESKSMAQWRSFLRATASGWDGNLVQRKASLDPDAYALELEEAERQRLDVMSSFRKLLDSLVDDYKVFRGSNEPPLFVVAIDDADMNPARSVELLDLVRALWHPRVAFLLTGDSKVFMRVLGAHVFHDLYSPLKGFRTSEFTDTLCGTPSEVTDLAAQMYEKAIPPEQRCGLRPLGPSERFSRLLNVLEQFKAPEHRFELDSLAEYFTVQAQAQAGFPERLRSLIDLRQRLAGLLEEPQKQPHELTLQAINILALSSAGNDAVTHTPAVSDLTWRPVNASSVRVHLNDRFDIVLHFGGQFSGTTARSTSSPEMIASAILAIDAVTGLPRPTQNHLGLGGFLVRVVYRAERPTPPHISWPLPDWETLLDYALLAWCWEQVTHLNQAPRTKAEEITKDMGILARNYLATVIGVIELANDLSSIRTEVKSNVLYSLEELGKSIRAVTPSWEELAARAANLIKRPLNRDRYSPDEAWVLGRAGLLAAPESGLDPEDANAWLGSLKASLGSMWNNATRLLTAQRTTRVRVALGLSMSDRSDETRRQIDEFLRQIDQTHKEHRWSAEFQPPPANLAQRLFKELQNISVKSPNYATATFDKYILPRHRILLARLPSKTLQRWLDRARERKEDKGATVLIATDLWKSVVHEGSPRFDPPVGHITASYLKNIYDSFKPQPPWDFIEQESLRQVGPSVLAREASLAWREETGFCDTPLGAVFEVVWDAIFDLNDDKLSAHPELCWWDAGGGVRSEQGRLFPWPAVDWPAFYEYDLMTRTWNDLLKEATLAAEMAPESELAGDSLAFSFTDSIRSIAEVGNPSTEWQSDIRGSSWRQLVSRLESEHYLQQRNGLRWRSVVAWCRSVPLLAAPESGLSREACTAILSGVNVTDERRDELQKARRERMRHHKTPKRPIEPELAAIDDQHPGHPWVELIERRS